MDVNIYLAIVVGECCIIIVYNDMGMVMYCNYSKCIVIRY